MLRRARPRPWSLVALALVCLPACSSELTEDDLLDPPVPDDAELSPDADVPLLAPNTGDDDASLAADDAPTFVADAADDDASVQTPNVPAAPNVSAPPDVVAPRDVVASRDVPAARDAAPAPPPPPARCTGSASGQSALWTCTADRRARQQCVAGVVHTDACAHGCVPQPSGTNDYCAPAPPPPSSTALPACAHHALLHSGLHPDASDRLRCAGVPAARITQTIGYATASAGTHAPDGRANGLQYSAATDISVSGLAQSDIRALLSHLADQGFAAWYRWPGHDGWPSYEAPHIHAIYTGCAMKASLQSQVRDWLIGRNGLVSHTVYGFITWSAHQRDVIRALFNRYN